MKSQQETTSLGQIATVTAKPKNKGRAFINTDMRRFKIQTGDMDPPPPWQGLMDMDRNLKKVLMLCVRKSLKKLLWLVFPGEICSISSSS